MNDGSREGWVSKLTYARVKLESSDFVSLGAARSRFTLAHQPRILHCIAAIIECTSWHYTKD